MFFKKFLNRLSLSGGEKQRIAIARVLLKDPGILILDEATSSLDSLTESLINKHLDELCVNRTTIIIAHRLNTITNADRIIVLGQNKILEEGTHDILIKKNGRYREMWNEQKESSNNLDS